jgi:hypothetical protein
MQLQCNSDFVKCNPAAAALTQAHLKDCQEHMTHAGWTPRTDKRANPTTSPTAAAAAAAHTYAQLEDCQEDVAHDGAHGLAVLGVLHLHLKLQAAQQ